jgi:hypothetical protein
LRRSAKESKKQEKKNKKKKRIWLDRWPPQRTRVGTLSGGRIKELKGMALYQFSIPFNAPGWLQAFTYLLWLMLFDNRQKKKQRKKQREILTEDRTLDRKCLASFLPSWPSSME